MSEERTIREVRLEKLQKMRELGHDPFAQERFEVTRSARQMLDRFDGLEGQTVQFAGRVVSYRLMGKAGFAHISDGDAKIQAYFRLDDLTHMEWTLYGLLDIGDHVGITGELFRTKTGEKSIHVRSLVVLSKALQSLPIGKVREIKDADGNVTGEERWYELEDVDARYRHRHLDLITNPEARKMLLDRARITSAIRHYFDEQGYLEVETPMLQHEAGGATARPFTTHYNAYEMDVKLRISLELYLKRIICGDVPRVYEVGRVFRNEGVSAKHSPEFTMCEFYEAYANLEDMMTRMEELCRDVAMEVFGQTQFSRRQRNFSVLNRPVAIPDESSYHDVAEQLLDEHSFEVAWDFASHWDRVDFLSEVAAGLGTTESELRSACACISSLKELLRKCFDDLPDFESVPNHRLYLDGVRWMKRNMTEGGYRIYSIAGVSFIDLKSEDNIGGLLEKLLESFVEPYLLRPTFVIGYPIETSPLAKKDPNRPGFTRRFEGYVLGRELCNAFSEINDPIDQRERFEQQMRERAKGDDEAHPLDEDFLYALESGMPPTGGCGFGIERMAMLLTGADHIREITMFPTMRPV